MVYWWTEYKFFVFERYTLRFSRNYHQQFIVSIIMLCIYRLVSHTITISIQTIFPFGRQFVTISAYNFEEILENRSRIINEAKEKNEKISEELTKTKTSQVIRGAGTEDFIWSIVGAVSGKISIGWFGARNISVFLTRWCCDETLADLSLMVLISFVISTWSLSLIAVTK